MPGFKQNIISEISSQLAQLGVQAAYGNGADIVIDAVFVDAKWSTGTSQIRFEASILADEMHSTVFMWQKTSEISSGFSFGFSGGSYYQNGSTLYRKVKAVQYAPDGKVYEYNLNLGAIAEAAKATAKRYGWKFKTVINREKASYADNLMPPPAALPMPAAAAFCTACGQPISGRFCSACGAKVENQQIDR
jgi:hypothetical protein